MGKKRGKLLQVPHGYLGSATWFTILFPGARLVTSLARHNLVVCMKVWGAARVEVMIKVGLLRCLKQRWGPELWNLYLSLGSQSWGSEFLIL
jgi:hypothetical protein